MQGSTVRLIAFSAALISYAYSEGPPPICCEHQATFTGSGGSDSISGFVSIDSGQVSIALDVIGTPDVPNGWDVCVAGGMSYHIHDKWTHGDLEEKYGSDCGGEYTVRFFLFYEI